MEIIYDNPEGIRDTILNVSVDDTVNAIHTLNNRKSCYVVILQFQGRYLTITGGIDKFFLVFINKIDDRRHTKLLNPKFTDVEDWVHTCIGHDSGEDIYHIKYMMDRETTIHIATHFVETGYLPKGYLWERELKGMYAPE